MNVLHNALKFSPRSSILRISYTSLAETLHIAFQDQGPGIALNEQQQVFERFFTSNSEATALNSGAGLGLSITKLIIDRIDGRIRFEPIERGAKCIIELPFFKLHVDK